MLGESERPEVAGAAAFSSRCLASRLELRVSGGSRSSRRVKAYLGGIFAKGLSSKISKDSALLMKETSYDGADLDKWAARFDNAVAEARFKHSQYLLFALLARG